MVRGWLDRGVDGFRLDTFNVFLKHPELPSNPRAARLDGVGPPGPPLRLRPAGLAGPDRAVPGDRRRRTRADVASASCSRHDRGRGRADHATATSSSTGSCSPGPGRPRAFRAAIAPPRAGVRRRTAGRPSSCPTTTSRATPRGWPHSVGASDPDRDAIARGCGRPVADHARHAVPVLRRGARDGRRRRPAGREHRPAGHPGHARTSPWWDRSRRRTPMPWTGGPGAGFTTGPPWLRLAADATTRNVATRAGRSRLGAGLLPPPPRRASSRSPALQDGRLRLLAGRRPDVLGLPPPGAGPDVAGRASRSARPAAVCDLPRPPARAVAGARRRHAIADLPTSSSRPRDRSRCGRYEGLRPRRRLADRAARSPLLP